MYVALKWLHVACVFASGTGFLARGALMLADSPLLRARWVRIAPHVIDSVLLATAIAMTMLARLSPIAHPWLGAKIGGLLAYIVLGAIALRRGRTKRIRVAALLAALPVFGYIVGTALQRDPLWPLRSVWAPGSGGSALDPDQRVPGSALRMLGTGTAHCALSDPRPRLMPLREDTWP